MSNRVSPNKNDEIKVSNKEDEEKEKYTQKR